MASYSFHYMIATHEDKSKVKDLYEYSYSKNFFEKIFPLPAEFINDTNEENVKSPRDWRIKNWGGNESPYYELDDMRKLSKSGTIFTTYFAMRSCIPFGIYDELHRQGFRVKAYYIMRHCFCGSYIYGVHEHIRYREEGQDVPDDIDWCFNVEEYHAMYCEESIEKTALCMKERLNDMKERLSYDRKWCLNDKEDGEKQCNAIESVDDTIKYSYEIAKPI